MSGTKKASLIILEKDGKILLMRRYNTGFADGQYTLPAGKLETDETFTEAAIREAFEEVNARIMESDIRSAHIIVEKTKKRDWIHNFFIAEKWAGEIKNNEPDKCDDIQWFNINSLPKNTISFVKEGLKNIYKAKTHYSK